MLERKILLWTVLVFFLGGTGQNLLCQVRPFDRTDFSDSFHRSDPMGRQISWRSTYERTTFSQGVGTVVKIISENTDRNRFRALDTTVSGDKTKISEVIYLNGAYYCRTDGQPWRRASFNCASGSGGGWLPPEYNGDGSASVEDAVLNGKTVKLFKFNVTYAEADGIEKFYDRKFWVDSVGRRLRAEASIRFAETVKLLDGYTEIYEYNLPDFKITAPIK